MPKSRKSPPGRATLELGSAALTKRKTSRKAQGSKSTQVAVDPIIQFNPANLSSEPPTLGTQLDGRAAVLDRLWHIIEGRKDGDPQLSHSARLLEKGTARVVQKLGEEAIECLIEAMAGNRNALIGESADLLYHLLIVWVNGDIKPQEVWQELERREGVSLVAGQSKNTLKKLPGTLDIGTTKIP